MKLTNRLLMGNCVYLKKKENMEKSPKLRTVEKYKPPYQLNKFPKNFAVDLGREALYLLASRGKKARLEGSDWEEIFAHLVGAQWKPLMLVLTILF